MWVIGAFLGLAARLETTCIIPAASRAFRSTSRDVRTVRGG